MRRSLANVSPPVAMHIVRPAGKMVANTGKYVTVWAKDRDGNWKAIHDIWNADK